MSMRARAIELAFSSVNPWEWDMFGDPRPKDGDRGPGPLGGPKPNHHPIDILVGPSGRRHMAIQTSCVFFVFSFQSNYLQISK